MSKAILTRQIILAASLVFCGMSLALAEEYPMPEYSEISTGEDCSPRQEVTAESLREMRNRTTATVRRKLKIAETLYRLKRYSVCAEVCAEIRQIDPACEAARRLREKALQAQARSGSRDVESGLRVNMENQARSGLEDSLTPIDGPQHLRPSLRMEDLPFAEHDAEMRAARENVLSRKLVEEISLNEAPLSEVLQLLFKITGVNIIYKPDTVAGKTVTIHAKSLQLATVLDFLVRTCNIGYKVEKEMIWIYSKDGDGGEDDAAARAHLTTVVIPLKYGLTPYPKASKDDKETASLLSDANKDDPDIAHISADPDPEVNPTDIGSMLMWMEKNWPGWPKESKWFIDRKLNRLVIASTPDIIAEVRKIVEMLDVPPIQVLISSQFVLINEEDYDALGFDFGFRSISTINYQDGDGKGGMKVSINPDTSSSTTNIFPNAEVTPSTTLGLTATIDQYRLTAIMQALKQKQKGRVVNAPRVIAYNNHVATISVGTKHWYATDVETVESSSSTQNTSSSSVAFVPSNYTAQRVGWVLEVLPSVGHDMRTIGMHIVPAVTTKDGEQKREIASSTNGVVTKTDIPIPLFRKQTLDVNVSVEDGKTVVIGGLYTMDDSVAERGTPVLKDIPVVGTLFRAHSNVKKRNALVIFVTAKIIRPDNGSYTDNPAEVTPYPGSYQRDWSVSKEKINNWLGDPGLRPARY